MHTTENKKSDGSPKITSTPASPAMKVDHSMSKATDAVPQAVDHSKEHDQKKTHQSATEGSKDMHISASKDGKKCDDGAVKVDGSAADKNATPKVAAAPANALPGSPAMGVKPAVSPSMKPMTKA
jgi:hypothetical protein